MKTCVSGRTEIMWNTHRVGVTADNIVKYNASSLSILRHSLDTVFKKFSIVSEERRGTKTFRVLMVDNSAGQINLFNSK